MSSGFLLDEFRARGWEIRPNKKPPGRARSLSDALTAAMHADHLSGQKYREIESRYGRPKGSVRSLFVTRGLPIQRRQGTVRRAADGTYQPLVPKSPAEIEALIQAARKLAVPGELKSEWRMWSLARRARFIARLRQRLASPNDRPEKPFSANVTPFDYGTREAWEIVKAMNAGKDSRTAAAKMDLRSQGVIHEGKLWFWSTSARGYFSGGAWTPERGRPSLHRMLYEREHGPVTAGMVVRFADGNPNNLTPANLVLLHKNDIMRENQAQGLSRRSRTKTAILLSRFQQHHSNPGHDLIHQIAQS